MDVTHEAVEVGLVSSEETGEDAHALLRVLDARTKGLDNCTEEKKREISAEDSIERAGRCD